MKTNSFEAGFRQLGKAAIVDLSGEIDASAHGTLSAAYAEASRGNPAALLLNFSGVGYINSVGLALIVHLLRDARQVGRRLLAFGLSDHNIEVFQITRLADYIGVFPDESSALASLPGATAPSCGQEPTCDS